MNSYGKEIRRTADFVLPRMVTIAVGSPLVFVALLVALNVVLFVPLVLALLHRRTRKVNARNLDEAFKGLEVALKQAVPDLPPGFTWGDALVRLKSAGVHTDGMESALMGYEGYRYGETPLPNLDFHEVVMVANMLGGADTKRRVTSLGQ